MLLIGILNKKVSSTRMIELKDLVLVHVIVPTDIYGELVLWLSFITVIQTIRFEEAQRD